MQLKQKRLHSLFAETPWTAQVAKKSAFNNGFNHNGPSVRWVSTTPSAIPGPWVINPCFFGVMCYFLLSKIPDAQRTTC